MAIKIETFNSAYEYVQRVKNATVLPEWNLEAHFEDSWAHGSFNDAVNLAENGWKEGTKLLTEKMSVHKNLERGGTRINDVSGEIPNVGRFLAGLPDCMTRRVIRESNKKPILDVYLSPQGHGGLDGQNFINLGAAMAMLIDGLEHGGYSVCLNIALLSEGSAVRVNVHGSIFNIKKDGEVLDIERMIYFIAHPTVLRRLEFKKVAATHIFKTEENYGMGRGIETANMKKYLPNDVLVIAPYSRTTECNNVPNAMKLVKEIVLSQRTDLLETMENAA